MINILCTRPLNDQLVRKAAFKNIEIDTASFIRIETENDESIIQQIDDVLSKKTYIVFTSMSAVEAVAKQLKTKPEWAIFCMGGVTKETVYKFFGEAAVAATAKNATVLAERIMAHKEVKAVTFFCGDQRLDELPETLNKNGVPVQEIVVYQTIETPQLIDKNYHGIVFFSPSAVHSFFSANTIPIGTVLFSIGRTTSAAIRTYCTNKIVTSEWPGKEQMIEQVVQYFS